MADIPSYQFAGSSKTGSTGPTASPQEFGSEAGLAAAQFGNELESGARYTARAINRMQQDERARQHFDDARWAGQAYEQEKRTVSEFMANPENHQKETFAQDLDKFIQGRMVQYYGDSSPTPKALSMFKEAMSSFSTNMYDRALTTGYQNRVTNGVNSIGTQVSDAVSSYRSMKSFSMDAARGGLLDSVAHIGSNIEDNFRKLSPNIADKMHDELITQTVTSSMKDHPELARVILDNAEHIDEKLRKRLGDEIDTQLTARNIVERESFNNFRADNLVMSERGTGGTKLDISSYKKFYPEDQATVQKMRDDAYIDSMDKANGFINRVSSWDGKYQAKELNDFQRNIRGTEDQQAFQRMHQEISRGIQVQEKDPAGWLSQHNPVVKSLAETASTADEKSQAGAIKSLNDAVLKFQGPPPVGASQDERKQYLDKPISDRHLMSLDEANKSASDLNASNPREFIKKMGEVLARYPDKDHQYIAFNDMVTVPSRGDALKQEYQLAWQNRGAWWLDTYLGAIQAGKSIQVPEKDSKDARQFIDNNSTWLQFRGAMVGDNFGRADQIAGFREGIQQYSHALIAQGMSPKDASARAVNMLISETLGITKVNGKPLAVARDQEGGRMQDPEVQDLGRRLGLALRFVDPREIDQGNFTALQLMGKDQHSIERMQALRDHVTARGFFQTGPDGKSASLYMMDDNNMPFQVRDHKNQPFNISFQDLPKFEAAQVGTLGGRMVLGMPETFPAGLPAKHYDLVQKARPDLMFSGNVTNWPGDPAWLHSK
jgi:hypothetical protein